nr:MAG TPA: hypothetical protein [Caudoviricetes sp.]
MILRKMVAPLFVVKRARGFLRSFPFQSLRAFPPFFVLQRYNKKTKPPNIKRYFPTF